MAAARNLVEELDGHAEHVGEGQHAHLGPAGMVGDGLLAVLHVGGDGTIRKHDAFRRAGGARGVVDDHQLVEVVGGQVDIGLGEAIGVSLVEQLFGVLFHRIQLLVFGI